MKQTKCNAGYTGTSHVIKKRLRRPQLVPLMMLDQEGG